LAYCNYLKKQDIFFVKDAFAYIVPQERSIDIDSGLDYKLAEILIKNNIPKLVKD
jgi:N-acylneuraminate cytidylyltransferase/CMP-N,N'-diacetyllegionaminic acid synthase